MKHRQKALGYRVWHNNSHHSPDQYCHTSIEVYGGTILDAANKYRSSGNDYDLAFLKDVRQYAANRGLSWEEKEQSTFYFYEDREARFTVRWQSHHDDQYGDADHGHWTLPYAMKIEDACYTMEALKNMTRVLKECEKLAPGYDVTPERFLTAVHSLNGVRIAYADRYSGWYINPMPSDELAKINWPKDEAVSA